MFLAVEPISQILDWVYDASKLVQPSHDGHVIQWFAKDKHSFFYNVEGGPLYTDSTLCFNGSQALELRGAYSESGPHTFVACGTFRRGTLLDIKTGPIRLKPKGQGTMFFEIQDSCPVNGDAALGSTWDGQDYFLGEISFLGYKKGLLTEGQKAYIGGILNKGYQPIKLKWYQKLLQIGGIYV